MSWGNQFDEAPTPSGPVKQLLLYLDALVQPKIALEAIKNAQDQGSAVAVSLYLLSMGVAALMQQRAADHVTAIAIETKMASASPALVSALHEAARPTPPLLTIASSEFGAILSLVLSSLFYFGVAAVAGQRASFRLAWMLAANTSIIVALTALANSAIVCFRGVESATTLRSLFALPAVGDLFGNEKLAIALSVYNVVNVFYYLEVVAGLVVIFGVKRRSAVAATIALSILTSLCYFCVATAYAGVFY